MLASSVGALINQDRLEMGQELSGIIETKIQVPSPRAGLVERSIILDKLFASSASLVLVKAPAGFGKSTLLEQWANLGARRFAWVSLDPTEGDPTLFWRYVFAAIRVSVPGFGSRYLREVASPRPDLVGSVVPGLLNELAAVEDGLVIVLDDYHRVGASEVDQTLSLFTRYLPSGITVAVGTRSQPGIGVAWLRSRGLVEEFGASDLSFSLDDTSDALAAQNSSRTSKEAEWIHSQTEGWPAGVYLLGRAESLDHSIPTTPDIRDYLMTEMLSSLSAEDLAFMRRTSVLSHLEAGLCDYVTQTGGGHGRLQRLANADLLVVPLDETGERFRYHHLLQTNLLSSLKQTDPPDVIEEVHRRAMEWTAKRGDITQAIHHAICAGEAKRAADLVSENWYSYLMSGRSQSAQGWLNGFTDHEIRTEPRLAIAGALLSAFAGSSEEARRFAAIAEAASDDVVGLDGAENYESSVAFMRAALATEGPVAALADARRAAAIEPRRSPYRPGIAAMIGAFSYSTGRNSDPYALLYEGVEADSGPPEVAAYALGNLALLRAWHGDRGSAVSHAKQAIARVEENNVGGMLVYGLPYAVMAKFAFEDGDTSEGVRMVKKAERSERSASNAAPFDSMVLRTTLAEAFLAAGDVSRARMYAERALGNLSVMREGGLIAARLDRVIRQVNGLIAEHNGHSALPESLLSARETQILRLLPTGETLEDIGLRLFISRNTVKTHVTQIYRKLGVANRQQALAVARDLEIL